MISCRFLPSMNAGLLMGGILLLSGCGSNISDEVEDQNSGSETLENRAPKAVSGVVSVNAGVSSQIIDLSGFASDPDGDSISIIAVNASQGSAVIGDGATILYTPGANMSSGSSDTVLFVVTDGIYEASATLLVNIGDGSSSGNQAPIAVNDSSTIEAGQSAIIDVLLNDIDPDLDLLSLVSVSVPTEQGAAAITEAGEVEFYPADGFSGVASISYVITDGQAEASGVISVTVNVGTMYSIEVSWSAPEAREDGELLDPTSEISKYVVAYKKSDWSDFKTTETADSEPSVLLSSLAAGEYEIKVAAVDQYEISSSYSTSLTASVGE